MPLLRTQFRDNIVAEFLPSKQSSNNVMILCDGLPSLPNKKHVVEYWSKRGYWVFHIRYRGTWESGGEFLSHEPHEDVLSVIDALQKPFTEILSGKEFVLKHDKIVVMGASFGGTTALMASLDVRVDKAIAFAPVVDWSIESESEPHDKLFQIIRNGYGDAYRCVAENWSKLKDEHFFNPISRLQEFDGNKIMIVHAQDDDIVYHDPVENFAQNIHAIFYSRKKGGHLSTRMTTTWWWSWCIRSFLK